MNDKDLTVTGDFSMGFVVTFIKKRGNLKLIRVVESTLRQSAEEVQEINFDIDPGEGEFTLSYAGNETDPIAYNASAGDVQTALRALPGLSEVTVTGDISQAGGLIVTFFGLPGDAEMLVVGDNTLAAIGQVEVQSLSFSPQPLVSGTFTINYGEEAVGGIPFNVSAVDFQAALRTIPGLGSVTVTGGTGTALEVTFTGVPGDAEQLTVTDNTVISNQVLEVQRLSVSQVPNIGGIILNYNGSDTPEISARGDLDQFNAAGIQAALRTIFNLENVVVTEFSPTQFDIEFVGVVGDQPMLTITQNTLRNASIEVQFLEFSSVPDAGQFKIQFSDQQTSFLDFDATAAEIQDAVRLLFPPTLEGTVVTGNFTDGFTFTFYSSLGDVITLEIVESTLTAGALVYEEQNFDFSAPPEKGQFQLVFNGVNTSDIAFDATQSEIQDALRAIASYMDAAALTNCTVNGDLSTGFVVTFAVYGDQPMIELGSSTLALDDGSPETQTLDISPVPDYGTLKLKLGAVTGPEFDVNGLTETYLQDYLDLHIGIPYAPWTVTGDIDNGFTIVAGQNGNIPLIEIVDNALFRGPRSELDKVTFDLVPDAGSVTVTAGETEFTIDFDDDAASLQTKARAAYVLSGTPQPNLTVTGDFSVGFSFLYSDNLGDEPDWVFSANTLTNMSNPVTPTFSEEQKGSLETQSVFTFLEDVAGVDDTAVTDNFSELTPGSGEVITSQVTTQATGSNGSPVTPNMSQQVQGFDGQTTADVETTTPGELGGDVEVSVIESTQGTLGELIGSTVEKTQAGARDLAVTANVLVATRGKSTSAGYPIAPNGTLDLSDSGIFSEIFCFVNEAGVTAEVIEVF